MAKSSRKSRPVSGKKPLRGSPAAKKGPPVKRRRRKLVAKDRIGAVLIAAVLIAAAALGAVVILYLHSALSPSAANVPAALGAPAEKIPQTEAAPVQKNTETKVTAEAIVPEKAPQKSSPPAAVVQPVQPAPRGEAPLPARAPTPVATPVPASPAPAVTPTPAALIPGGVIERPPVESRGTLVFVIDDAGNNLRELEPFLTFPGPLTIAVLPALPNSAEAARRIRAAGKEVFLHQPMEALGGQNPGPGAIREGMGRDEIRAIINRNLNEIGPVAGINNHEGSRVTMDEDAMETVLALCREKGLLFLDSRTTAETAVPKAARQLGMTIIERNFFLDNKQDRSSINAYINSALARAEKSGSAVCIGHVQTAGLAPLLDELYPSLVERGYSFSSASGLINGKGL